MTDHPPDPASEPSDPTPAPVSEPSEAEEAGVRRLLAEARHDVPVPADVATRLDAVLAGLRDGGRRADQDAAQHGDQDGGGSPRSADVTDLGARRRRAGRLLVAAAAAVVVGLGVGVVRDHTGSILGDLTGGAGGSSTNGDVAAGGAAGGARGPAYLPPSLGRPVRLTPARFAEQVRLLRRDGLVGPFVGQRPGEGAGCVPAGLRRAALVPVRYAGDPGLLAFRPPAGDSQVVDLYLCGQDRPIRSVTLPAR